MEFSDGKLPQNCYILDELRMDVPFWEIEPLKRIEIINCNIQKIDGSFARFPELKVFVVRNNELEHISDDVIPSSVVLVDVSNNRLKQLSAGFFTASQLFAKANRLNLRELTSHTLQVIDLSDNYLSSLNINCPNLRHLTVNNCHLDELVLQRSSLQKLDASHNRLTDLVLGDQEMLTELDVSFNALSDMRELPPNIIQINASNNRISSFEGFERIETLQVLILESNNLRSIPDTVVTLLQLERLNIARNDLRTLPAELCLLKKLRVLKVEGNMLRGLGNLMNVSTVNILKRLERQLPAVEQQTIQEDIGVCNNDQSIINIEGRKLTELPPVSANLVTLEASRNMIRSVAELEQCPRLETLRISSNRVENVGVLQHLPSIKFLDCGFNPCGASLFFSRAPEFAGRITHLNLSGLRLTELPHWISQCEALSELIVSDNQISEMPRWLLDLPLTVLDFSNNSISTPLFELGHMESLRSLSLSGNLIRRISHSILTRPIDKLKQYFRNKL
ncbi:hypothetical protein PCE1_000310 [Barthelona sp. PCE]